MILFISDLHLSSARPALINAFLHFLKTTAIEADALYILGDFFDVWLGDDDDNPDYQSIALALKSYREAGHKLYFIHGNRDFLLGEQFAHRAGMTLLSEPSVVTINKQPILLMHGDTLCTRDEEYMAFREVVRNQKWQSDTLAKPLSERKALAAHLRETSQSMNSLKAEDIMDVTPDEVTKVMTDHQVEILIHGHTHRPATHSLPLDHGQGQRIVLGDWGKFGWYVKADETGFELCSFSID